MNTHNRWLAGEIDRWVGEGMITPEQGASLRTRYPVPGTPEPGMSWGLIVFFALGAIVVGLGVILLFAYNWAAIPKAAKLAIIFGSIAAAHGAGVYFRLKDDWRSMLGEGLLVLGTMLFGAGIWLVAQVYNIDEHFPTGFLVWGLGALALAWAVPSIPQAIVATLVLTLWSTTEVAEFDNPADLLMLAQLAALGGLVWRLRSSLLAAIVLAGTYVQLLAHAGHWGGAGTGFTAAIALSVGLIAVAELVRPAAPPRMPRVLRFYGLLGFVICAYLLSFADFSDDLLRPSRSHDDGVIAAAYRWSLTVLALGAWAAAFLRPPATPRPFGRIEAWFYPLGLVCVAGSVLLDRHRDTGMIAVVFNLILLCVSALWTVQGCRDGRLRPVVLGSVVLGLLVLARYFDLFDSLAARGLAFLLFGGALFAEGFFYRRMRLERAPGEEATP